jgi:hypothetical protein
MTLLRHLLATALFLALTGRIEAACQINKVATLHVTLEDNRIMVPGKINGTSVKFILATDIESLILPVPAHDLGLRTMVGARLEPIIYDEEYADAMGMSGPVNVDELTLDGVRVKNMVMHVIGKRMNFGQRGEIAVIGRDFLVHYDVEFNLAAGEVTLYHPLECDKTNLAYWSERYNVLEMEHHLRGVRVKASVNGREVIADINSANPYTALSVDTARQLGVSPSVKGVTEAEPSHDFLANDPIPTWDAPFDSFSIDQELVKPVSLRIRKLTVPPPILRPYRVYWDSETGYARPEQQFVPGARLGPRGSELSLGVDFIRTHRMLIAYSQRLVYFSHNSGEPFLEPSKER